MKPFNAYELYGMDDTMRRTSRLSLIQLSTVYSSRVLFYGFRKHAPDKYSTAKKALVFAKKIILEMYFWKG